MSGSLSAGRWTGCSTALPAVSACRHSVECSTLNGRGPESSFSFSFPAVDVTEDDQTYKITAEVPGLEEKNIDVTVLGDMLKFKGERRYEKDEEDKNRHVSERAYGSFQRSPASTATRSPLTLKRAC
jgi:hypothetical protein